MSHSLLLWIVPVLVSAFAAVIDFGTGRIPNWLTFPTMAVALAQASVLHGLAGFTQASLGLLLCGAVPWLLHRLSGDFWYRRAQALDLYPCDAPSIHFDYRETVGAVFKALTTTGNETQLVEHKASHRRVSRIFRQSNVVLRVQVADV